MCCRSTWADQALLPERCCLRSTKAQEAERNNCDVLVQASQWDQGEDLAASPRRLRCQRSAHVRTHREIHLVEGPTVAAAVVDASVALAGVKAGVLMADRQIAAAAD